MGKPTNFKFVSPGVKVNIIDNTGRIQQPGNDGACVITRTRRGPALRPVEVQDLEEYITLFGNPIPGGESNDVWRNGNFTAPAYGTYAAQAWLRNSGPLTVVRLLGTQHTDATAAGEAGWETKDSSGNGTSLGSGDSNGGAYALFLVDSASAGTAVTGSIGAVWYINEGSIALSGTLRGTANTLTTGSAVMVESVGANQEFKAIIRNGSGDVVKTTTFNFNKDSSRFIRKVFNTNPTLTNASTVSSTDRENYWLGESFEREVQDTLASSSAGSVYGMILGLRGDDAAKGGQDFRFGSQPAQTGWFISQDLNIVDGVANTFNPETMPKLFRFHGLENGEWESKNLKISIEDIKASTSETDPFGTFTVHIRKAQDTDGAPITLERFTNLNLDPSSPNYIAKVVGDKYMVWSDTDRRFTERGQYENRSKFVRVEMNEAIRDGSLQNARLLPFGVFGPPRHKGFALSSGSTEPLAYGQEEGGTNFTGAFVKGGDLTIARAYQEAADNSHVASVGVVGFTGSFKFPDIPLRTSTKTGNLASPKLAYFGATTDLSSATKFDRAYYDMVRPMPSAYDSFDADNDLLEYQWVFTLDNVSGSGTTHAQYVSGSRAAGNSLTAKSGNSWEDVLDQGFTRFTSPMFGGFDGMDITEQEPFRNTKLDGGTSTTNYAFNSVKRAIDSVSRQEDALFTTIAFPGLTNEALTNHMINVAEDRGDCIAIIDLEGDYVPSFESTNSESSRMPDLDTVITNKITRGIDSWQAASYFPWVRVADPFGSGDFWCPPSVIALGTWGYTEVASEVWFAPAGFRRGILSNGQIGIQVIDTRLKLYKEDKERLAIAKINPINRFVGGDIVVYGQDTMQAQDSALSKINVARLVLWLKRRFDDISKDLIFEPNVRQTWQQFLGRAEPLLKSVKARLGLERATVLLDEETTTPELRDRNIMYAKLFLVPAKSAEHFLIDFALEPSGANF